MGLFGRKRNATVQTPQNARTTEVRKTGRQKKEARKDLYRDALPEIRRSLIKRGLDDYYRITAAGLGGEVESRGTRVKNAALDVGGATLDAGGNALSMASNLTGLDHLDGGGNALGALNSGASFFVDGAEALDSSNTMGNRISAGADAVLDAASCASSLLGAANKFASIASAASAAAPIVGTVVSGLAAVKNVVDIGKHSKKVDDIRKMKNDIKKAAAASGMDLDNPQSTATALHKAFRAVVPAVTDRTSTQISDYTNFQDEGADRMMEAAGQAIHENHVEKAENRKAKFTSGSFRDRHTQKANDAAAAAAGFTGNIKAEMDLSPQAALVGFERMLQQKDILVIAQTKGANDVTSSCFDCVSNIISCAAGICDTTGVAAPIGAALGALSLVVQGVGMITSAVQNKKMAKKNVRHEAERRVLHTKAAMEAVGLDSTGKTKQKSPVFGGRATEFTRAGGLSGPDHKGKHVDKQYELTQIDEIIQDVMDEVYSKLQTQEKYQGVLHTTAEKEKQKNHGYWNTKRFKRIILYEMGVPSGFRADISNCIAVNNAARLVQDAAREQQRLEANAYVIPGTQTIDLNNEATAQKHQFWKSRSMQALARTVDTLEKMQLKDNDIIQAVKRPVIYQGAIKPTTTEVVYYQKKNLPDIPKVAGEIGNQNGSIGKLVKNSYANPFVESESITKADETDIDSRANLNGGNRAAKEQFKQTERERKEQEYETNARTEIESIYASMEGKNNMRFDFVNPQVMGFKQRQMVKHLMRGEDLTYRGVQLRPGPTPTGQP